MNKKIAVLAFSGGLDTTYCAVFLKQAGYNIHAVTINTGGFSDTEIRDIETHAYSLGINSFTCIDERKNFYDKVIRYLIYGNVLKNNTYPLSVSAERVCQALAIADFAKKIDAAAIVHGSTGAGNDQVRFDMIFNTVVPNIEIITPIRDMQLSREEEINFLEENGVAMNFEKAAYSINKGLWGTSIGGRETLTAHLPLPDTAYPTQLTKEKESTVTLHFRQGVLSGIDNMEFPHPVDAILYLQQLVSPYAIGRDIHTGDTIIGIKGRVGFEAAAPLVILKSHHALEKHVLTKWQLHWKDQLAAWYGNWLHEGQFLDPVMRNIEAFLENSQQHVTGKVFVRLKPYGFIINGIESAYDLMSPRFGSYGEMNRSWTADDVKGFTKIFGNQVAIYMQTINENEKKH